MDFFAHQDAARRNTGRLVVLFILAVIGIILAVYALVIGVALLTGQGEEIEIGSLATHPALLGGVTLGTLLLVGGSATYKIAQLRSGGGGSVAELLGGRPVSLDTTDTHERRLLNVVEEMAIASGVPTPSVYLLAEEPGINAFAAGYTPHDAVIGVTRGTMERLTRDELQGVIAHEFSHILNGDMRLNIRLMGLLHGILVLGIVGYYTLRVASSGSRVYRSSRSNKGGDPRAVMFLIGGGLMLIGSVGTFFGALIKAAVSRQREFLADAAAVQFTRNPSGIADALKRIGGLSAGSRIVSPNGPQASHMFFGQAVVTGLNGLFATHPPLPARIRRIEPAWDGKYLEGPAVEAAPMAPAAQRRRVDPRAAGLAHVLEPTAAELVGRPTREHLELAAAVMARLHGPLAEAAQHPFTARAVVCATLLSDDGAVRSRQLGAMRARDAALAAATEKVMGAAMALGSAERIALVELAAPALRQMPREAFESLRTVLHELVEADQKISLFEWSLGRLLDRLLRAQFEQARPVTTRHYSLRRLGGACSTLLSAMAYASAREQADAELAFQAGAAALGEVADLSLAAPGSVTYADLERAMDELEATSAWCKRSLIDAAALAAAADGRVAGREYELLRAVAATLECPMPPLLPGQRLGRG